MSSDHTHLSIATGYWDIEGTALLLKHIENYEKIRILIGREPLLKRDNHKGTEMPEPDYPDEDFFTDLKQIDPSPRLAEVVMTLKKLIDTGRLEVRVYRRTFLHAKCYIFGDYTSPEAIGIIGSSNFTKAGLSDNAELNALDADHRIVTFRPQSSSQETGHLSWFDEMWNDEKTEAWTGQFIELLRTSPNGDLLYSPRELYLRTLYELYKDELQTEGDEIIHPHARKLFEFQEKNVKNLVRILKSHGVAMLADSVGLGKTMSCVGVIKQYPNQRIVVVAPAALRDQWEKELVRESLFHVRVISLQNKQEIEHARSHDEYAPVGLFVIDESHNLRTANATRYELLADWIASSDNENAHVLLATATPINNSLDDLVNQILLGARGDQDVFTVPTITAEGQVVTRSLYEAVGNIKKRISQRIAQGATEDELMGIYRESRDMLEPVIRSFVIRNTRQSIGQLIKEDGTVMTFPDTEIRVRPYEHAQLDRTPSEEFAPIHNYAVETLSDTMERMLHPVRQVQEYIRQNDVPTLAEDRSTIYRLYQLILALSFVPYRWRMYDQRVYGKTREELRAIRFAKSEEREAINRQISLYGIIRTTFLKRLESSAHALEVSLSRYERRLSLFEDILIRTNAIPNLSDIDDILDEYDDGGDTIAYTDEQLVALVEEKGLQTVEGYERDLLIADIITEKKLIKELQVLVGDLKEHDEKYRDFKQHLLDIRKTDPTKKVLVFSFFSDTVEYLHNQLQSDPDCKDLLESAAFVSGGAGRTNALDAADRFSPIARNNTHISAENPEITYLFTTDVLSEGQNLQDAGHLINYDLHWNPVRMIQRNGRINRIGSSHKVVTVENYVPTVDLETFLGLVERLRQKIELIKHIIGTDASVLGEDIDPRSYTGIYSTDTAEAGEAYAVLENDAGSFVEDQFKKDLLDFYTTASDEERRRMERIPYGSWTRLSTLVSPNEVVTFAAFTFKANGLEATKPFFFGDARTSGQLDMLTSVQALKALRSDVTEHAAKPLVVDAKQHEATTLKNGAQIVTLGDGIDGSLTPTQKLVHEQARAHGWSPEEQDALHATMKTRNVILQRKVSRLTRSIGAALKANKDTAKEYARLKKLLKEPKDPPIITASVFCFGSACE